jgi:hypothetical protein
LGKRFFSLLFEPFRGFPVISNVARYAGGDSPEEFEKKEELFPAVVV